jgi:actin-related protein
MEKIWHQIFYNELNILPEEHPVIFTECALNPIENQEHMIEIMFETFNIPILYSNMQSLCSLYASGRTTGCVVDLGHEVSHIVPVYDGNVIKSSIIRMDIGGNHASNYLLKILNDNNYILNTNNHYDHIIDIKEKYCYVAKDFDLELRKDDIENISYELPDGINILLGNERFRTTEIFFQPSLILKETCGIHDCIFHSIMKCKQSDIHHKLYNNIILSGNTSMFKGMIERISIELYNLLPNNMNNEVRIEGNAQHAAWIGASMIANHSNFQQLYINKAQYDEIGSTVVHRNNQQLPPLI